MKLILALLVALMVSYIEAAATNTNSSSRVAYGTVASLGQYPWVVSLMKPATNTTKASFYCAGTLIHEEWVITTATCIGAKTPATIFVCTGSLHYLCTNSLPVLSVTKHPGFIAASKVHDLALVRLAKKAEFTDIVDKARMVRREHCCQTFFETNLQVQGWGHDEINAVIVTKLRSTSAVIHPTNECVPTPYTHIQMHPGTYCSYNGGCAADEGGPAMYKNMLCGVVSIPAPVKLCTGKHTTRHMRVCMYYDWIMDVTKLILQDNEFVY